MIDQAFPDQTTRSPAVGRLDHDLEGAPATAHRDTNQLEAHADDGRGHDVFDSAQKVGHVRRFLVVLGQQVFDK